MFSSRSNCLNEYHLLNNRLKKKRILKKPNIAEALEQFESLAIRSEASGYLQVTGLSYRSAARCAGSLGHTKYEANFLMKSARAFIGAETALVSSGFFSTEENFQEGLKSFNEACDRLCGDDPIISASFTMEMADKLANDLKKPDAAISLLKKSVGLFTDIPLERINCLRQLMLLLIQKESYTEALKSCSDAILVLDGLPDNANSSALHLDLEVHRVLLLLIVEPPAFQVSKKEASVLEKLTWIENSEAGEITDLGSTLVSAGLSFFSTDLFILLQSLVMACQSCDSESLPSIEKSLQEHLDFPQISLLRTLVRYIEHKSC